MRAMPRSQRSCVAGKGTSTGSVCTRSRHMRAVPRSQRSCVVEADTSRITGSVYARSRHMRAVTRSQRSCVAGLGMSTGSVCTRSLRRSARVATGTRRRGTDSAVGRPGAGRPAIRDAGIYTYYH